MTLLITKKPNGVFSFVLAGDYSNEIKNIRNDLLTVGNFGHFKTSNGANLIKYQNISPTDVTIADGVTTLNPTTTDELFSMLRSVGYFDWLLPSGGSGVSRFVDLSDTFGFFGQDGKTMIVDEAQMKLIPVTFYNVQNFVQLADVPNTHVAGKWLKSDGTKLIFADLPTQPTDTDSVPKGGYEGTGEDLNNAIDNLQEQIDDLPGAFVKVPKIQFTADGITNTFDIGVNAEITAIFREGALLDDGDWSQSATTFTLTFVPEINERIKPI